MSLLLACSGGRCTLSACAFSKIASQLIDLQQGDAYIAIASSFQNAVHSKSTCFRRAFASAGAAVSSTAAQVA
jgi:hypothetical protein